MLTAPAVVIYFQLKYDLLFHLFPRSFKSEVELVNYFENVDINLEKKQNEVKGLFNKIDNIEVVAS